MTCKQPCRVVKSNFKAYSTYGIRGVAGGSAGSARADPKFWLNSTVLLYVPTLNFRLFLLVPTLTKIPSYGPGQDYFAPCVISQCGVLYL